MFNFQRRFYLRERESTHEKEHKWGRGTEGEGEADSPDAGLSPRTWDADLSGRQTLNQLNHPGDTVLLLMASES